MTILAILRSFSRSLLADFLAALPGGCPSQNRPLVPDEIPQGVISIQIYLFVIDVARASSERKFSTNRPFQYMGILLDVRASVNCADGN
jgi:hypothetical protein